MMCRSLSLSKSPEVQRAIFRGWAVVLRNRANNLRVEQFRIVACEYRAQRCGCALFHPVDFLNQSINVGRHDQQISDWVRAWIPVGVRRSAWHEHSRARVGLNFLFANLNAQSAFQHVPRFVVVPMKMRQGDQTWRTGRTAWVAPLGDHKRIGDRTDDLPSEWRSNFRPTHRRAARKRSSAATRKAAPGRGR